MKTNHLKTFEQHSNKDVNISNINDSKAINESSIENDILMLKRHFHRVKHADNLNLVLKDIYVDIISILKRLEERTRELKKDFE